MNNRLVVCLWILGGALTASCAPSPLTQTINLFHGGGYRAVESELSHDRISEKPIPPDILTKRTALKPFFLALVGKSAVSEKDANKIAQFWRKRAFETAYSLEKHFYENRFDSFTNSLNWVRSDFDTISLDIYSMAYLYSYTDCILTTLFRLLEETVPQ
ncbi:MAG: hypothetical protein LBW77_00100, partial [Verrucomicrobiota bacterium]|nr:hypothetical protein [Verrucomicrobiota bacterium]